MTLTIELPPELESDLAAEAQRLGIALHEYVLRLLASGRSIAPAPQTGAELVAYWQAEGVVGTRPEIVDSQSHARALREHAERRARP